MPGVQLDLANPNTYESPREYVEKHLAPLVTDLHRITNELISPGATSAEEWVVDMVPETAGAVWQHLDRPLETKGKHVVFDGSAYQSIPADLLRQKQLKVQLTATVYAKHFEDPGAVEFRLVRDDGMFIKNTHIATYEHLPYTHTRVLPFGELQGCISPDRRAYFIEGCSPYRSSLPVCRRFSLSFIYI